MFEVKNELPKAPLYREEFEHDNCGIGACVTCACTVAGQRKRVCKDGPVFNALEVEWDG